MAALLSFSPGATAGTVDRAAAAAAFDDGVNRFERADYATAARSFLKADELAPSADALRNAIAAARKGNEHLLMVEAAERGLARADNDADLATLSRDAIVEAARSLSRLSLSCEPGPCSLFLDGQEAKPGQRYLLPGVHPAGAVAEDGNRTDEDVRLAAGAAYTVVLHAVKRGQAAEAAKIETVAPAVKPEPGPVQSAPPEKDTPASSSGKPLPPVVFYVGVGATAVLTGLTVWSGIDTLNAKSDLPNPATKAAEDDVRGKMTRSDVLFGSAVVVGALTVTSAFLWVDWGNGSGATATLVPTPGGVMGAAQGRF